MPLTSQLNRNPSNSRRASSRDIVGHRFPLPLSERNSVAKSVHSCLPPERSMVMVSVSLVAGVLVVNQQPRIMLIYIYYLFE